MHLDANQTWAADRSTGEVPGTQRNQSSGPQADRLPHSIDKGTKIEHPKEIMIFTQGTDLEEKYRRPEKTYPQTSLKGSFYPQGILAKLCVHRYLSK